MWVESSVSLQQTEASALISESSRGPGGPVGGVVDAAGIRPWAQPVVAVRVCVSAALTVALCCFGCRPSGCRQLCRSILRCRNFKLSVC